MHIMDIAENSINAGADRISILIEENRQDDHLRIIITDNGRGMPDDFLQQATDPFVTTGKTRRVGLGLSLLKEAALRCNGSFRIGSAPGKGVMVEADFEYHHIDRAPMGDISGSITALIFGNPGIDFSYRHILDGKEFGFDTSEFRSPEISLQDPETINHLTFLIRDGIENLSSKGIATFGHGDNNGKTHHR
ncbi:MAG: ATP-binding protein [Pseudomonadota bacterium]